MSNKKTSAFRTIQKEVEKMDKFDKDKVVKYGNNSDDEKYIKNDIVLTEDQQDALDNIIDWIRNGHEQFKSLSGYAGSGKTVLMDFITDYTRKMKMKCKLTAPTNKAVRVLTELVEHDDFSTIHSLLNIKAKKKGTQEIFEPVWKGEHDITLYDLVIVDECSMVSEKLLKIIRDQIDMNATKVLFVGDPAQLQPINETISKTFDFEPVHLNKIVRYGNVIAQQAKKVRSNTEFVSMNSLLAPPEIVTIEKSELGEMFQGFRDNPDKVRMACWTNNAVNMWNTTLRNLDYGRVVEEPWLEGDFIMANEPCESGDEIIMMNSEEGYVKKVDEYDNRYELTVKLVFGGEARVNVIREEYKPTLKKNLQKLADEKNWTEYWYYKKYFHDIRHCYALTTHKHQGSTYGNIILNAPDISLNRDAEERNQLIYVGMTRAEDKVMIFNGF